MAATVLAEDQVAPGCRGEPVGALHHLLAGRLDEQLQRLGPRQVAVDLAEVMLAADRVGEPDRTAPEVAALEPVEASAAFRECVGVGVRRIDRPPDDPQPPARVGEVHVVQRRLLDRQSLQLAARVQGALAGAGVVGDIAVEERRAGVAGRVCLVDLAAEVVLGQIDDPGAGVDRQRLMGEEAHVADRRSRELVLRARGIDFEYVAVTFNRVTAGEVLLAGQPGAPRRRAAGAVVDRPAGDDELVDHLAIRVEDDRRGAAGLGAVIGPPALDGRAVTRRRARGCGRALCRRRATRRRHPRRDGSAPSSRSAEGLPPRRASGTGSRAGGRADRPGSATKSP